MSLKVKNMNNKKKVIPNEMTKNDKKVKCFSPVPLIFPPVCGICGRINKDFLCNKCKQLLERRAKFLIEKYDYSQYNFSEHFYAFKYEGIVRGCILNYKFNDNAYLYKMFTNFLLKHEKLFEFLKNYDTIIPVPISRKRFKQRGYNQSYLIAKEIAKHTNLCLDNDSLFKTKNVIEQSKLNKENRLINVRNVYKLKNVKKLENKSIVLVDDIFTTGSTVRECCGVLKLASPKNIGVLTIAKD